MCCVNMYIQRLPVKTYTLPFTCVLFLAHDDLSLNMASLAFLSAFLLLVILELSTTEAAPSYGGYGENYGYGSSIHIEGYGEVYLNIGGYY